MRADDADYIVTVYCDDGHDERVISRAAHFPRPDRPLLGGWIEWRELLHEDLTQSPALQTPFGEKMRRGSVDLGGPLGIPRGMDYQTRWVFKCLECPTNSGEPHTVPVHGQKMEAIFETLRQDGRVSRISLPQIASRLNT